METLAQRIQWIFENMRRTDGKVWGPKSLALDAGLAPSHISSIVNGKVGHPRTDTIEAIARTAGVSVSWLMTGEGEPTRVAESEPPTQTTPLETDPVIGNLENFPALLAQARQKRKDAPEWGWAAVTETRLKFPGKTITAGALVAALDMVLEVVDPPPPGVRDLRAYYRKMNLDSGVDVYRNSAAYAAAHPKP